MRILNRTRLVAALALGYCVTPWPAAAQQSPNQARFLEVKGWQGGFTVTGTASGTVAGPLGPLSYQVSESTTGAIFADRYDASLGGWTGTVTGTSTISEKVTQAMGDCQFITTLSATSTIQTQSLLPEPRLSFLTLDLGIGNDTWSFWFSDTSIMADSEGKIVCPDRTVVLNQGQQPYFWSPLNRFMGLAFPSAGFALTGRLTMPDQLNLPGADGASIINREVTWNFNPIAVRELEVVVDPEGHDTWRPEATKSEDEPGNKIAVKASLQWSDGSALSPETRPEKFVFQLAKVSHEPGVALNFPIKDGKATADLQFRQSENPKLIVSGDESERAETLPSEMGATATAVVSAFDWGAWGEIQASAVMPGGQIVKGYLRGDKPQTSVRLPKRPTTSFIADVWKQQQGVDKPDNDDSEPNPTGLPGCDGDGFTLYEEYRGFYENGKHIEGNPNKKDFFIFNLVGAEAEAGIWLFTDLTGLEVHKDLTEEEFIFQERLINKNHDLGPHRVDQHGVYITTCTNVNGGSTGFSESGLRGRPYITLGICIQDRSDTSRVLGRQYNLSGVDFAEIYDKAVAHELLHTVGSEHHGEGDKVLPVELVFPDDPGNTLGRPYFKDRFAGTEIQLRDEKTLLDPLQQGLYEAIRRIYDAALAQLDALVGVLDAATLASAREFAKTVLTTRDYQWGVKNGQHSGDDQCVMRYNMAEVFKAEDSTDLYYLVPAGTEPSGLQLCTAGEGTGVNQARDPQPRYFNAAAGRGSCKFWVCPNDAIPPGRP